MAFLSLSFLNLLLISFSSLTSSFIVIPSDAVIPSALIDGPQSGFSLNTTRIRTDSQEQQAVYDIMKATGNGWATNISDVCRSRWHGIECMPDEDNVYHIVSLSFGDLSDDTAFPTCDPTRSFISPAVTKLRHIRTLFFFRCFNGNPQPIPSFLGQLGPSLRTLVLRENQHVGPIPMELTNLTRLTILDLHDNNLNGSIPISLNRLVALRSLDLSRNKLTGFLPSLNLPNLRILDLSQNLLTGSFPTSIATCRSLVKLDFSRNRLMGSIPDSIGGLVDLVLVDLSFNRISSPVPISLGLLSSLEVLNLKGNPMGPNTLPGNLFDGMMGLMTLVLSNMGFHGPIPVSLGRLQNLRVLHLDGNYFNGSIPLNFQSLKNLHELRLNDNWLTGPIPLERDVVWRMKRKLRLYNNSGLCYGSDNEIVDGSGASYNVGIGVCRGLGIGSDRTVQHLSMTENDMSRSVNASPKRVHRTSLLVVLLQLMWVIIKLL